MGKLGKGVVSAEEEGSVGYVVCVSGMRHPR